METRVISYNNKNYSEKELGFSWKGEYVQEGNTVYFDKVKTLIEYDYYVPVGYEFESATVDFDKQFIYLFDYEGDTWSFSFEQLEKIKNADELDIKTKYGIEYKSVFWDGKEYSYEELGIYWNTVDECDYGRFVFNNVVTLKEFGSFPKEYKFEWGAVDLIEKVIRFTDYNGVSSICQLNN